MNLFNSNYKTLEEFNLLIVVQEGLLNLESMMYFIQKLNSDPVFSPKFDHFVDLSNVTFDLSIEDINKYVLHLKSNSEKHGNKKIALITNTPNQVVYSTLFKLAQEKLQPLQNVQIFSTYEKAFHFLNIQKPSAELVLKNIKSLKKSFSL